MTYTNADITSGDASTATKVKFDLTIIDDGYAWHTSESK